MSSGYVPTRKVTAGGLAGALSVILVYSVNTYVLANSTPIPAEIASAVTTILTFAVSYVVPSEASKT